MSHHKLRFERRIELKCRRNDDHESRCAERTHKSVATVVNDSDKTEDIGRNQSYESEIDCAEKRDPVADLSKMICRRTTRSDARDKSAVLLNVLSDVIRIELNGRIEVCEEYDEYRKEQRIKVSVSGEPVRIYGEALVGPEKSHNELRERQDRIREDERENAGTVYLDRNERGLSAVHLSSLDLLCILNRDLSLRHIYRYDASEDDENGYEEYEKGYQCADIARKDLAELSQDGLSCRSKNTNEDQKRDTIADTEFGDPFADPHRECRSCAEDNNYTSIRQPFKVLAEYSRVNAA